MKNRSMPSSTVLPVLSYPDVDDACDWLCRTFGFSIRWKAGHHRAQLNAYGGCVVVAVGDAGPAGHSIMIRVSDVNAHHTQVRACGAAVVSAPANYPYGERQYTVRDLAGYVWTFSQTIADIDPQSWGASVGELD
jgi:uncharacterized glyoxalase superfamily protein PhnB